MPSKKNKHKYKKFIRLVCKQYQLENELKSINEKLSKCKPEIFIYEKKDDFAKIREKYFTSLQCAVAENLKCCSSVVNEETVESLSLIVEQDALLASIQQSAYQRAVSDVIREIREATSRNSLYPAISFSLALSLDFKTKASTESPDLEKISYSAEINGLTSTENNSWAVPKVEQPEPENYEFSYQADEMLEDTNEIDQDIHIDQNSHEIDPDLADFIINFDGVDEEFNQEVPHSYDHYDIEGLIGILEGKEKTVNPETDPETEHTLDKIQELLRSKPTNNDNSQRHQGIKNPLCPQRLPSVEMWRNERYIYNYKVLKKCSEMDAARFFRTRKLFNQYFGEDSDFEQEDQFDDKEKYLSCCSRRIMPLVIQYITPYREQIRDASIFKQLTQRIANSMVTINDSPSHSEIEQYVARFFANGKKFFDLSDVWLLEVD